MFWKECIGKRLVHHRFGFVVMRRIKSKHKQIKVRQFISLIFIIYILFTVGIMSCVCILFLFRGRADWYQAKHACCKVQLDWNWSELNQKPTAGRAQQIIRFFKTNRCCVGKFVCYFGSSTLHNMFWSLFCFGRILKK